MFDRRIPEWLRHAPTPSVRGFAVLNGCEAIARGTLTTILPLTVYDALRDTQAVSAVYFAAGLLALVTGLCVPMLTRVIPRRWTYALGCVLFALGAVLVALGGAWQVVVGLLLVTQATVVIFVCTNAYVLDHIAKAELGRYESSRLFYSALGWTVGPGLGVTLHALWPPAPFVLSAAMMGVMLAVFAVLRFGNGRLIQRARRPSPNPLTYMPRFLAQPRLVAGWLFAVLRSCGWWVYIVYMPIFAVQSGLSAQLGGWLLSATHAALFLTPVMLRWMQRHSLRHAVRTGFLCSGLLFCAATALAGWPLAAVLGLACGALFLILLDVSAGLPFLLAVRPGERTEMSAIYSSFRDVSGILTPGVAWAVLAVAPLPALFATCGLGLLSAWHLARHLHPRLGRARVTIEAARPTGQAHPAAPDPAL